jgi:hypothetical protein
VPDAVFVESMCDAAWNNQLEEVRQIMRHPRAADLIGSTNGRGAERHRAA